MKIALIGYGKMGRMLDQLAPEFGHEVVAKLDVANRPTGPLITPERLNGATVAIEFTQPEAVLGNIELLAAAGVHVVVGTTGWTERLPQVEQIVARTGIGLVWSPNFSVGVNLFMRLIREAGRLMQNQPQYGAHGWEIHHAQKKDSPSGTMLKLVDELRHGGYTHSVDVVANRAGFHPGTHEMEFDSLADTITLRHTARSREGFARGALQAAGWIQSRHGCYEFSQTLFE